MTDAPDRRGHPAMSSRSTDTGLRPDQVERRAAAQAAGKSRPAGPSPAPAPLVHARAMAAEAKAATARALESGRPWDAERALAVRSEAAVAARVARWTRPALDGDAGPNAPGRGPVVPGRVVDRAYSAREGDWVPSITKVVRRGRSAELDMLPPDLRATAERFEVLAAAVGRMACVDPSASPARGRLSDGGAASRCDDAAALAAAVRAIGDVAILKGRYASAHADRRRAITARDAVEAFCVKGWSMRRLLGQRGWTRCKKYSDEVRAGFQAALGRMMMEIG